MSLDTAPNTQQQAAADPRAALAQIKPGRPVLAVRDLFTPAVAAVVLALLYFYVQGKDLDTIEQNLLDQGTLTSRTIEHIYLSLTIAALVIAIAVPLGVLVTRRPTRFLAPVVIAFGNLGQSAPVLGLLAFVGIYAIGFWAVVWILTAYAALSVLRNTIVGLEQVDKGVLDAARGMGMSPAAVLFKVELPLAVPIIGAGARTAMVLAVGTVPLGYALNAGGLGQALFGAIKTNRTVGVLTVAVMIAILALLLDWAAGIVQRAATPRGIR